MRTKIILITAIVLIACASAFGQNTIKLFDATPITTSDTTYAWNPRNPMIFDQKDIYLSGPVGGSPQAYVTGPNNGSLIVDNFFTVNGYDVCPDEWNCFAGLLTMPNTALGLPMESAYVGVAPIDVSSQISGSGTYTFVLSDFGQTYGNSDIYLNTSCSFGTYVCHRNNGRSARKTLAIDTNAVAAHLAHGDTEGPCEN